MNEGTASLVVDPNRGFEVVLVDRWGCVFSRTGARQSIEEALTEGSRLYGEPLVLELKRLAD